MVWLEQWDVKCWLLWEPQMVAGHNYDNNVVIIKCVFLYFKVHYKHLGK